MKPLQTPESQLTSPRLPASTQLGTVSLQVRELQRSLDYYQLIGLHLLERSASTALLGTSNGTRPLVQLVENQVAKPVPRRGRLGLYHFAILVPERADLGSFLKHLAALGVNAGMADHSFSEALYLSDPDGLGIEVYADRPRSSWQFRHGEIVATTDALNTDSLLQAADKTWQGMPAGTVIGHLHFYVAELDSAARFYQQGLGFDVTISSYPGALFVSAGGYHHHVGLNTWAAGAALASDEDARLLSWELELENHDVVATIIARLNALGFHTEQQEGVWQAVDPWGSRVQLKG